MKAKARYKGPERKAGSRVVVVEEVSGVGSP